MYNSKFIQIWSTFNKAEQNRFYRFVHSPYHNKHEEVKQLLDYFQQHERIDWKSAWNFMFPKTDYYDAKIRNLLSYLQKLMDKFLVYELLEQDELQSSTLLLQAYRKRKIPKAFDGAMRYARLQLEKTPLRDAEYYFWEYQLQSESDIYQEQRNPMKARNLQEVHDSFETYYLAKKLHLAVAALAHQAIFKTEYRVDNINAVLDLARQEPYQNIPAIALYYYSYLAQTEPKVESHFFKLKEQLIKHLQLFPTQELKGLFIVAINYCIRQMNKGEDRFTKEIFDLYKEGLNLGVFIEKQEISRFTYKNIVSTGLKLREFDWTKTFINEYASFLAIEHRQTNLDYNLAKYYYMTTAYEDAMQLLLTLQSDDLSINLGSRVTLLKIYYELGEWSPLESLVDSFGAFVRRNKAMSEYHKKSYKNLLRFVQKLLNYNFYDAKEREKLRLAIQTEEGLPERDWLLERIEK